MLTVTISRFFCVYESMWLTLEQIQFDFCFIFFSLYVLVIIIDLRIISNVLINVINYHFRRAWARILQQKNRIVEVCNLINWRNNWLIPSIWKLVTQYLGSIVITLGNWTSVNSLILGLTVRPSRTYLKNEITDTFKEPSFCGRS